MKLSEIRKKFSKKCRKCEHYNECDGSKFMCKSWQTFDMIRDIEEYEVEKK